MPIVFEDEIDPFLNPELEEYLKATKEYPATNGQSNQSKELTAADTSDRRAII